MVVHHAINNMFTHQVRFEMLRRLFSARKTAIKAIPLTPEVVRLAAKGIRLTAKVNGLAAKGIRLTAKVNGLAAKGIWLTAKV
ncbi:hypothetical protein ED312_00035, partial [Sinomicrobium pectinilyticum]